MIYFEDLEIGAETYFGSYEVTREEVLEFARKYDPQPFHLSDEEAAKTHFGRLSASGWHTCAMTMAVIARHVVDEEQAGSARRASTSCAGAAGFSRRYAPCRGRSSKRRRRAARPDMGSFRTQTTVTNQDDQPVLTFTSIVLIRRRARQPDV